MNRVVKCVCVGLLLCSVGEVRPMKKIGHAIREFGAIRVLGFAVVALSCYQSGYRDGFNGLSRWRFLEIVPNMFLILAVTECLDFVVYKRYLKDLKDKNESCC